ncbi:hypothetical protein [Infirmifilum uzonense]|uniref:hypothetical protein n=1 Tax=Infirmifilum uzonense TaxID=1550241 RepID=UPI003C78DC3E
MTENFVKEASDIFQLASKLRKYFVSVASAYQFLFIGSFMTAYWLLVVSLAFALGNTSAFYWNGAAVASLIPLVGGLIAALRSIPQLESRKRFSLKEAALFGASFTVFYTLPVSPRWIWFSIAWYPSIAVSLLGLHLLYERGAWKRGEILSRPFLVSSIILIVTSPLIVYVTLNNNLAGWFLSLGLMLLSYAISALIALMASRKIFVAQ